jgi:hypothetical protein
MEQRKQETPQKLQTLPQLILVPSQTKLTARLEIRRTRHQIQIQQAIPAATQPAMSLIKVLTRIRPIVR